MPHRVLVFVFAAVLFPQTVFAQIPPAEEARIEADRPDFTEATSTVPPSHLQLEGGYTFTYDDEDGGIARAHSVPELLARLGVADDLELRLGWVGYLHEREDGERREGVSDLSLGVKHALYPQEGYRPELSILLAATVPSGSSEVSDEDTVVEGKLLLGYALSEEFAVAGNVNAASPVEENERYFEASASLSLSYAVTDRVGGYLEYFGFYPNADAPDSSSLHFLNTGFSVVLTPSTLLDARIGAGLNDEAEDLFVGVGFAKRWAL